MHIYCGKVTMLIITYIQNHFLAKPQEANIESNFTMEMSRDVRNKYVMTKEKLEVSGSVRMTCNYHPIA